MIKVLKKEIPIEESLKKEIPIEESLKKKIEFICEFCGTKPTIKNGSIRSIEHTNINYIEPHQIFIKGKLYLAFNYSTDIYVKNLGECIPIKELEKFIKEK